MLTGLDDLQPKLVLELVAGPHRSGLVSPYVPLGSVLADHVNHDVDVVAAILSRSVVDGDPPALGLAVGAGKAHLVGEVTRDLLPPLVSLRRLPGAQGQGAVPYVVGDRSLDDLTYTTLTGLLVDLVHVEHAPLPSGAGAGLVHELVDVPGDLESLGSTEPVPCSPPAHDHVRACHQVRTGVLVGPSPADEVLHEPGGVSSLADSSDHRRAPSKISLMSSCSC